MIRRKLAFGLVLVLGFACQKKGGSDEGSAQEATAEETTTDNTDSANTDAAAADNAPATDPAFLVGKWQSDCINQPGYIQASLVVQYEFVADGNASTKTISYAGADCTKRFTKPDVDALIAQENSDRAIAGTAALNAAELAVYNNLWFPQPNPFTFKLARTLKDGSVEMNAAVKSGSETVYNYLTVYVKDNILYFAQLCSKADLDAGTCSKIVGDSVINRAKDMSQATPFRKL